MKLSIVIQEGPNTSALKMTRDVAAIETGSVKEDSHGRSSSNFITQVVATFLRVPQTCSRRRREPGDAVLAYDKEVRISSRSQKCQFSKIV
jgi:hypothetical protein